MRPENAPLVKYIVENFNPDAGMIAWMNNDAVTPQALAAYIGQETELLKLVRSVAKLKALYVSSDVEHGRVANSHRADEEDADEEDADEEDALDEFETDLVKNHVGISASAFVKQKKRDAKKSSTDVTASDGKKMFAQLTMGLQGKALDEMSAKLAKLGIHEGNEDEDEDEGGVRPPAMTRQEAKIAAHILSDLPDENGNPIGDAGAVTAYDMNRGPAYNAARAEQRPLQHSTRHGLSSRESKIAKVILGDLLDKNSNPIDGEKLFAENRQRAAWKLSLGIENVDDVSKYDTLKATSEAGLSRRESTIANTILGDLLDKEGKPNGAALYAQNRDPAARSLLRNGGK